MGVLTPSFVFDFESNMQAIVEDEYSRMVAANSLWWQKVTRVRPSGSRKEVIAWLLSTAMIKSQGKGGNIEFDDLVAISTEYENLNAGIGLKLKRDQLEDADGKGLEYAAKWSRDVGAYMAYWPQRKITEAILNGGVGKGYDGKTFFATDHPYNPFDTAAGTFANVFTGGASGAYPGACRLDDGVTLDTALVNLSKVIAYVGGIKMPNGQDPRFLVPRMLLCPPRMTPRIQQLTNAKFIAQNASVSGAGGSADVSGMIANWGFAPPVEVAEFGANFSYTLDDQTIVSGADDTCYLAVEQITSSQLGAMVYVDREPFRVTYYTGQGGGTGVDAILDRARELEWHCQGRNVAAYGHPYLLFKLRAS